MTSKIWLPKEGMCLKITVTEDMEVTVNRESVREYVARQRDRYRKAGRAEKGRILDEVVAVTEYHRKSAVRLLSGRSERVREAVWAGRSSTARRWQPQPGWSMRGQEGSEPSGFRGRVGVAAVGVR